MGEWDYWTPEPIWQDDTAFVLASGPSLTREIARRVEGRRSIVVNSSCTLAPWADVLYFTDNGWYEPRRELVRGWAGLVVSPNRAAKRDQPDKIRRVQGEYMSAFPPPASPIIRFGRSSGQTAISLAIALGASRVVMLGFDCRVVDGREHCHDEYPSEGRDLDIYAKEFLRAYAGWRVGARAAGVEILNATPDSAIQEFPAIDLSEALR